MELTESTMKRKVMHAENKLRKKVLNDICKKIDDIEGDRHLDDDIDATIQLAALENLKKRQLASWRQFRTKNGLSNEALQGV